MSPIDHNGYRPPSTLSQFWRWLVESMWRIEHAFERNKAEGRAVDDARLRIFLVLTLFGLGFIALGAEASKRALFSHLGGAGVEAAPPPEARADLVDRNGELLATDVTQYSVYLDPRDISPGHEQETRDELADALPRLSADRLDKAMKGGRRAFLIGDLNRQERDLVHDLGRPGVEFQEVPKRVYPLGPTAAHLIGFADTTRQIAAEQQRVRLLRAELSRLEAPARLERLSTQYLGMTPAAPKQEAAPDALANLAHPGIAQ